MQKQALPIYDRSEADGPLLHWISCRLRVQLCSCRHVKFAQEDFEIGQ